MGTTMGRAGFLQLIAAMAILGGCGGGSRSVCANYTEAQVKNNVLKKFKEKYSQYTFTIENCTFDSAATNQFWYVRAIAETPEGRMMIFAMHYCDGSIELTALNRYQV